MKPRAIRTVLLILVLLLANRSSAGYSALASGLPAAPLQPSAPAGTSILVNTTTDELNGDGDCSLREAIRAANTNLAVDACAAGSASSADKITLQGAATYTLSIAGADDTAAAGDLDIADDLTIQGSGAIVQAGTTTANGIDRVFHILAGQTVRMFDLTIRHGRLNLFGGGIEVAGALTLEDCTVTSNTSTGNSGGGIHQSAGGSLTLIGTTVSSNTASTLGGGLNLSGSVATLVNSTITNNHATNDRGGGIRIGPAAIVTLITSTVSNNDSGDNGGGIFNEGSLTLAGSTVHTNQAGVPGGAISEAGGGIYNQDSLTIKHSTIRNNNADDGAGITNDNGVMTILNSTINNNTAISAGGIRNNNASFAYLVNTTVSSNTASAGAGGIANNATLELSNVTIAFNTADSDNNDFGDGGGLSNAGTTTVRNSLIGENIDATTSGTIFPDCSGGFTSAGYNLIESTTGCVISGNTTGNITGTDPNLAVLAGNGGRTQTNSFPDSSPPEDAGNPGGCVDHNGDPIPADQRDGARLSTCDQGSYEFFPCLMVGDVNDDGDVDNDDFNLIGAAWAGRLAYNPALDLVVDGLITVADLQAVAFVFGTSCN